jgi:hypothetical protein
VVAWLAGVLTLGVIAIYVALSLAVNGVPAYPSAGWVAVVQPASEPAGDVVQLLVLARADGTRTRAAYDVVVCGSHPYTGDLLIGGPARFSEIVRNPVLPPSIPSPKVQNLRDLVFGFGGVINLGSVQLVRISLPTVNACPPSSGLPAGVVPGGSDEGVTGFTDGPVQRSWAGLWGLWHGPHMSQAWPLTGIFPGVALSIRGEFTALAGLTGSWSCSLQQYNQISAADVPASLSVDSEVPSPTGPYPLFWQSSIPLAPTAKLTDTSSLATLQDWVVIFAVAFGITGSILASLLFEWLRPGRRHDSGTRGKGQPETATARVVSPAPSPARRAPRPTGRWLALVGAVIVAGYVRSRLARARNAPELSTDRRLRI